ncbi:MAG: BlaI/MecI/CopY family transcriptional regulator [Candidatus Pacebacteria bacterium]|nr:BlaI/MecI/CopY family transcriptional regulator [Candidatus Paceibacterota bacterium]
MKKTKLLGELETGIMETIWRKKEASVRDVLECLQKKRKIAYTTVMTVMSRLYDKKILKRRINDSGAYVYSPICKNKQEFLLSSSRKAIDNLVQNFGEEIAVSQFLDFIESKDTKTIKKWQEKLRKIK